MCVAAPVRVAEKLEDGTALVEHNGKVRRVSVQMVPDVQPGEFVLLNLGVAVQKLSEAEAREILDLWQRIAFVMTSEERAAGTGDRKDVRGTDGGANYRGGRE